MEQVEQILCDQLAHLLSIDHVHVRCYLPRFLLKDQLAHEFVSCHLLVLLLLLGDLFPNDLQANFLREPPTKALIGPLVLEGEFFLF